MRARLADESGVSIVLVALAVPVLVLVMSLVIDVGNWFEHKQHLQMQADAAAFAGGDSFSAPCADGPILTAANGYSGVSAPTLAGVDNSQVGGTPYSRMHIKINSQTYYNQSSPVDNGVPAGAQDQPCLAKMVDVKLTETDLPWFFRLAGVSHINAHARVSIRQETTAKHVLPIAVPDSNPVVARAYFVNEASNTVIDSVALTRNGTSGGLQIWDNATAPKTVAIGTASRIGVRIAFGGGTSTTCGGSLVQCYDGIDFIQGYSTAGGTGAQPDPVLRDVRLVPGGTNPCTDTYFVANTAPCTIRVRANIAMGTKDPVSGLGATVTASVGSQSNIALSYDSTNKVWNSGDVSIGAKAGPQTVALSWIETKGSTPTGGNCTSNNNKCKGTFDNAQRIYSADANSGPIALAQVCDAGLTCGVDTQAQGGSPQLVVRVGIASALANAASAADRPVALRVEGSQNQSLDCDPSISNLKGELQTGCNYPYTLNTGTACTGGYGSGPPYQCVPTQTGNATNQIPDGLNSRLFRTTNPTSTMCTTVAPNNWSRFPNLPQGDPRIIQVFVTPFGTFQGSGNASYPIINFAAFYLTGYSGNGSKDDPCSPANGGTDDAADPGFIVGHFIKLIDKLNDGSGGTSACDLNSFGACVAVLTE